MVSCASKPTGTSRLGSSSRTICSSTVPSTANPSKLVTHLRNGSLQRTLSSLAIRSVGGREAVALARLTKDEAALLGRVEGEAFLATRRTVHAADGRMIERVDSLLHPDPFRLDFGFGEQPR